MKHYYLIDWMQYIVGSPLCIITYGNERIYEGNLKDVPPHMRDLEIFKIEYHQSGIFKIQLK